MKSKLARVRVMKAIRDRGYWTDEDFEKAISVTDLNTRTNHAASITQRLQGAGLSIDYHEALDALMQDTLNRVIDLTAVVKDVPLEEHDLREHRALFARFDIERKLAAQIAKDAIAANVDQRRLELDEAKADRVIRALARAAAAAELTPEQEEALRTTLADQLRELPSGN